MTTTNADVVNADGDGAPGVARFTHRAVLAGGAIGFLLGVLVATAVVPLMTSASKGRHGGSSVMPTPIPYSAAQLRAKVTQLADASLGRYVTNGRRRLESVSVRPDVPIRAGTMEVPYDVGIRFLLEPNFFGPKFQVGEAQSDSFLILQAMYVHNLPIQNIDLYGMFQFPKKSREELVLRAASDPSIAASLGRPWHSLGRGDVSRVWSALHPHWLEPAFRTYDARKRAIT